MIYDFLTNELIFPHHSSDLSYPNLFITIAPGEWRFPMHGALLQAYVKDRSMDAGALASIHMYNSIVETIQALLMEQNSQWFNHVYHHLIRLEYQDRGTIHFHVAIWTILKRSPDCYTGRTDPKNPKTSEFHAYLENLFNCHIDVQWTTGRLNYINGYTTKGQDSMDFLSLIHI